MSKPKIIVKFALRRLGWHWGRWVKEKRPSGEIDEKVAPHREKEKKEKKESDEVLRISTEKVYF